MQRLPRFAVPFDQAKPPATEGAHAGLVSRCGQPLPGVDHIVPVPNGTCSATTSTTLVIGSVLQLTLDAVSGAATATTTSTFFYRTLYGWTLDTPGSYSIIVMFTVTAP